MNAIKFILLFTVLSLSLISCSSDGDITYISETAINQTARAEVMSNIVAQNNVIYYDCLGSEIIKELYDYYVYQVNVVVRAFNKNGTQLDFFVTCYVSVDGRISVSKYFNEELFINYKK